MTKLLSLYGLKFHPFRPDVPIEALFTSPAVDSYLRRVELGIADGGFAMLTGDPGTGKSVALRLLAERLRALPDVLVGTIEHPQSRTMDFYRELGDLFGVPLASHNRWGGFKALRARWGEHIASTRCRPVLSDSYTSPWTTVTSPHPEARRSTVTMVPESGPCGGEDDGRAGEEADGRDNEARPYRPRSDASRRGSEDRAEVRTERQAALGAGRAA